MGGFVGAEGNVLARQLIAESMSNVGGRALFCRHAEFLGSLGSLQDCLHRHREAIVEGELGEVKNVLDTPSPKRSNLGEGEFGWGVVCVARNECSSRRPGEF